MKSRFWFISNADIMGKSAWSSSVDDLPSWNRYFWNATLISVGELRQFRVVG
jgi:hypothetical protein